MWNLKRNATNELIYETDLQTQRMNLQLLEGRYGGRREFGMDMSTLLYLKWITNKDLQYSAGNAAQCFVAAWMGREFGGERIRICVWLSPSAVHLSLSQHC